MAYETLMQNSGYKKIDITSLRSYLVDKDPAFYDPITHFTFSELIIEGVFDYQRDYMITVTDKVVFKDCFFNTSVMFHNLIFNYEVILFDCCSIGDFVLHNTECKEDLMFDNFGCESFKLEGGKFKSIVLFVKGIKSIILSDAECNKTNILSWESDTILDYLKILNLNKKLENISINITTKIFEVSGINESRWDFNAIKANVVNFCYFFNEGQVNCSHIQPINLSDDTIFQFVGSNLNKSEFYSINFTSYRYFNVTNSSISDCLFINCTWKNSVRGILLFNNKKFIDENKLLKASEYSSIKEDYRQLKLSMSKHNDRVQEVYFYANEMNFYDKIMDWGSIWKNQFWDKLILRFSRHTSNYGQSFGRPLVLLFGVHQFLFLIALLSDAFKPLHISFSNPTYEGFTKAVEYFFTYINPFRTTNNSSMTGLLILIDLGMRIWSGYMIYNLVRASRRFIT